jgi:hypothetical protein
MRQFLKIFLLTCFLVPTSVFGQTSNIGIIKGIWFSSDIFFAGDTVRIYTALQNNSGFDVEGNVEFFDNGASMGSKPFSALDNRIIESWVDTLVTPGRHEYSIQITNTKKNKIGEALLPITPQSTSTQVVVVVEKDTDGDNISDNIDNDDDNDGYSDSEEIKLGTDSLDANDVPRKLDLLGEIDTEKNILENFVDSIISKKTDEISTSEGESKESEISVIQTQESLIEQAPFVVENLVKENQDLKGIVSVISLIQNKGREIIESQKSKIQLFKNKRQKRKNEAKKSFGEPLGNVSEVKKSATQNTSFSSMLLFVYTSILTFFSWIFNIWWFWLVFPFVVIYFLAKYLFKIFGKK